MKAHLLELFALVIFLLVPLSCYLAYRIGFLRGMMAGYDRVSDRLEQNLQKNSLQPFSSSVRPSAVNETLSNS